MLLRKNWYKTAKTRLSGVVNVKHGPKRAVDLQHLFFIMIDAPGQPFAITISYLTTYIAKYM